MKKLLIVFATALSLSVIFAAGWASGKNTDATVPLEPASVQSEETGYENTGARGLEDGEFDGNEHCGHHRMPRFRFQHLVLPGLPRP